MAEQYVVERAETIAAPAAEIYARIGNLEGWEDWSPWADLDPEMDTSYSGEQGTVGSSYHWTGNRKVGEGRMTVAELDQDERVKIDLEFLQPFKAQNIT